MTAAAADDLLSRAIELHKTGDVGGAIRSYEKFLKKVPRHAVALNLLGLAYFQSGKAGQAAPNLERALALRPDLPGANYNLGTVLQAMKRFEEAALHFEKALALNPRDFEAHNSLASVLVALNRKVAAITHFEKAIGLRPDYAPAHFNLAKLLLADKELKSAAHHYQNAIFHGSKLVEAYIGLATALRELQLFDDAIKVCEQAVALAADNAEAHYCFARVLYDAKRFKEALEQNQRAIALKPDFADAYFNLAASYYVLNQYGSACDNFSRALALGLRSECADKAKLLIAWSLQILGNNESADRIFDKIIAEDVDGARVREAKKGKGMMYLRLGKLAEGWLLYDYRLGNAAPNIREGRYRQWNGEALTGTLWIWGEQGLGDQILHAGMIADVRTRVPSIILEVEPRLVDLYARSFPGVRVVAFDTDLSAENIQAQVSIADLGRYFRTSWDLFPKRTQGYLVADPRRSAELRSQLRCRGEKIVGLSWRSVSTEWINKSAQLVDFVSVLRMPGIRFIDLQYGETGHERAEVERAIGVSVERVADIDNTNDINGLAALMSACDGVVSVSNTNAHLAGALGRPTWVFVPFGFSQMWYWFSAQKDSPWYARVRVEHQTEGQSWEDLISSTTPEIAKFIASSESS